jgi:16S rRNA (cytidine1402-2'-O)-methyltransferase
MRTGALYVVATPIGNLEDITVRAVNVLRSVDLIACEDTRKTRTLLRKWEITTRLMSLHRFSEARKTGAVLKRLEEGLDVALVSDAGTPAVSDPGSRLVRAALDGGFKVIPIPGPSSITTALSVSGTDCSSFVYLGFAPRKDEQRRRFFERLAQESRTALFFETSRRIKPTLESAAEALGSRRMVLMRELSKIHEEILSDTAQGILGKLEGRPAIKGEIIVVVEGASPTASAEDVTEAVRTLMGEGLSGKRLAEEASTRFGVKKNDAYAKFLELKKASRSKRDG